MKMLKMCHPDHNREYAAEDVIPTEVLAKLKSFYDDAVQLYGTYDPRECVGDAYYYRLTRTAVAAALEVQRAFDGALRRFEHSKAALQKMRREYDSLCALVGTPVAAPQPVAAHLPTLPTDPSSVGHMAPGLVPQAADDTNPPAAPQADLPMPHPDDAVLLPPDDFELPTSVKWSINPQTLTRILSIPAARHILTPVVFCIKSQLKVGPEGAYCEARYFHSASADARPGKLRSRLYSGMKKKASMSKLLPHCLQAIY